MRSFLSSSPERVDTVDMVAWIFVVFRTLHSAVHCIFNLIILRFYLYLFGTLAVWFITSALVYPLQYLRKKPFGSSSTAPTVQGTDVKKVFYQWQTTLSLPRGVALYLQP